jgi:hypothetical protein
MKSSRMVGVSRLWSLLLICQLFAGMAAADTYSYLGAGGDFNLATSYGVGVTTTYSIPVSDLAIVDPGDSVEVFLDGLQYPFAADLQVNLAFYSPSNNLVPLASGDVFNQIGITMSDPVGYDAQFGDNYQFDSGFSGDLWGEAFTLGSSDIIPGESAGFQYWTTSAGSNTNDNLSNMFGGLPIAGTWVLTVTDYNPPFGNNLPPYNPGIIDWGLNIQATPTVPEPSTGVVVGLAAAVAFLVRRRRSANVLS